MRARTGPAAATARAGIAAAVVALALAACGSNHPRAVGASTTLPTAPPPTSTSRSPASASNYLWTRDTSPALTVGGGASSTLAAVLAPSGSSPWIVAGTRLTADGGSTATVWTSRDGSSWQATALTGPKVDSQAEAATTWHTGTVVVGSVGRGTGRRAAVWISPTPGASFAAVTSADLLVGNSAMTSVTSGTLGLFASGTAAGHVAMWYSSDGRRWITLTGAERVIGASDDPHVDALLATADEGVYAAGWDRIGSSMAAAVWSSPDGVSWHPVLSAPAAFSGPGDHLITAMAPLRNGPSPLDIGLVAVGGTWTGSRWAPASWISPNGASWSRPSTAFSEGARSQPGAADAIVLGLSAVPSTPLSTRLVAVGGGPTAPRLWESTDGLHWAEVALPPAAAESDQWQASLVAAAGTTAVVADGDPGQPHVLVDREGTGWLQPSADALTFGAVQTVARPTGLVATAAGLTLVVEVHDPGQVLGPGSSSVLVLASVDGISWSPVASGSVFAGANVTALTAAPAGFVAVGWRQVGGQVKAVAWTSPDGRTWRAATPLDARPTPGSDEASGVCASRDRIVAVGSAVTVRGAVMARAWTSSTGTSSSGTSGASAHWVTAPVSPAVPPGSFEAMTGCSGVTSSAGTTAPGSNRTSAPDGPAANSSNGLSSPSSPNAFDAFGSAVSSGTAVGPAFWASAGGTAWTRQSASPFGPDLPYPALDVARTKQLWVAATGVPGPDPGPTVPPGESGLWLSTDAGATWRHLDTSGTIWQGLEPAQFDRVAVFGTIPVITGQLDGRLAVWVGTPT